MQIIFTRYGKWYAQTCESLKEGFERLTNMSDRGEIHPIGCLNIIDGCLYTQNGDFRLTEITERQKSRLSECTGISLETFNRIEIREY